MRMATPRVEPLPEAEWDENQRELMSRFGGAGEAHNIFKTLVRHPKLLKRWLVFGNHVLAKSTLPPREREIVILRTGWLCRAGYEWGQHVRIGKAVGLTEEEIRRITEGPEAPGWDAFDATLLRATDELHDDSFLSDATWGALAQRYDECQLTDLIFTIGQYHMVSMALNSLGVQLEEGVEGLPQG